MLIYQRHILYALLQPVLGVTFVITGFVWLSQVMKLVYLVSRGVEFQYFLYVTLLILPYLLFTILPLAVTIGIIIGYNRLSHDRELLALNSIGLDPMAIASPAICIATVATICAYGISIYLLPVSYSKLKTTLNYFRENFAMNLVQDKVFTQISKNTTIYVDEKQRGDILKSIVVFDKNIESDNITILFAQYGKIIATDTVPVIELYNGMRQTLDNKDNMSVMHFSTLSIALHTNKYSFFISDTDKKSRDSIDSSNRSLQEYFIGELFNSEKNGDIFKKSKLIAAGHHRLVWPLYNTVMAMLAAAIFLQAPYRRMRNNDKVLAQISITVIATLILHFCICNAASIYPPVNIVLYINIALCFILGYYLLTQNNRKK